MAQSREDAEGGSATLTAEDGTFARYAPRTEGCDDVCRQTWAAIHDGKVNKVLALVQEMKRRFGTLDIGWVQKGQRLAVTPLWAAVTTIGKAKLTEARRESIVRAIAGEGADLDLCCGLEGLQMPSTVLQLVASGRRNSMVRLLLSLGSDPCARGYRLFTAVHMAAQENNVEALQLMKESGRVRDWDIQNDVGTTPLQLAVTRGHVEAVEFLLQQGVDVNRICHNGASIGAAAHMNAHRGGVDQRQTARMRQVSAMLTAAGARGDVDFDQLAKVAGLDAFLKKKR